MNWEHSFDSYWLGKNSITKTTLMMNMLQWKNGLKIICIYLAYCDFPESGVLMCPFRATAHLSLPGTVLVYVCCLSIIINSVPFTF